MGKLILNSLEIRRFRAFEHLKIEHLDRLLHHAEAISITGKSYRMKNRLAAGKGKVPAASSSAEEG